MDKVACGDCGVMILEATAIRNSGLCARCVKRPKETVTIPFGDTQPDAIAYNIASILLALNAAIYSFVYFATGGEISLVIAIIIDIAIALMLFLKDESARIIAIGRAILGVVYIVAGGFVVLNGLNLYVVVLIQLLLSGALITLLACETVRWRLILSSLMGVGSLMISLLVTILLMEVRNF